MARFKSIEWNLLGTDKDPTVDTQTLHSAVLMDIRDELKQANTQLRIMANVLSCSNCIDIPNILRKIKSNTANLPKVPRERK